MMEIESLNHQSPAFFFYKDNLLLFAGRDKPSLPAFNLLVSKSLPVERQFVLPHPYYGDVVIASLGEGALPADLYYEKLRPALQCLSEFDRQFAGKAFQIIYWYRTHQYCGQCGKTMQLSATEFMLRCKACQLDFYPRLSPVAMILIHREHEILLARSPHFLPGRFSALAGFVEPGETIEEACKREVKEEVNIAIKNLRYFGSQPWPFPHSLMIAFHADYAGGEIEIDNHEIVEAGWFGKDNLPDLPAAISIARRLIEDESFLQFHPINLANDTKWRN